jgi:hypothetical protein
LVIILLFRAAPCVFAPAGRTIRPVAAPVIPGELAAQIGAIGRAEIITRRNSLRIIGNFFYLRQQTVGLALKHPVFLPQPLNHNEVGPCFSAHGCSSATFREISAKPETLMPALM